MKRVLFSVLGTIGGLAALLSFKSQSHPLTTGSALPDQSLSSAGASSSTAAPGALPTTGASSTPSASGSTPTTTSRRFVGGAVTTRYGVVQVKITVTGTKITDVGFAQLTAFDQRSQEINSMAAATLLQETLSAQSADVDTVSGATYTSDGYRQSLQSALDAAGIR